MAIPTTTLGNELSTEEAAALKKAQQYGIWGMTLIFIGQLIHISVSTGFASQYHRLMTDWAEFIGSATGIPKEHAAVGIFMTTGAFLLITVAKETSHALFLKLEYLTVFSGIMGLLGLPDSISVPLRLTVTIVVGIWMFWRGEIKTKHDFLGFFALEVLGVAYIMQSPVFFFAAGILLMLYALIGFVTADLILIKECSRLFLILNILFSVFGSVQLAVTWEQSFAELKELISSDLGIIVSNLPL